MPSATADITRQNGVSSPFSAPYCTRKTPANARDSAAMATTQFSITQVVSRVASPGLNT